MENFVRMLSKRDEICYTIKVGEITYPGEVKPSEELTIQRKFKLNTTTIMNNEVKHILLVEDDPFLIDIYTTKLKEANFETEVAIDGEKALTKLKERKFDLLLLDIILPQIDGWEILRKIKQDPELKNLKVVILSNLGQREEVEKGLKLGAIKYFIKAHFTPSEVVAKIKQLLSDER